MRTRSIIALLVLLFGAGSAVWIASPKVFSGHAASEVSFATSSAGADPRFTNDTGAGSDTSNDISEENVVRNYGREILRLNPQGQGKDAPIIVPNEAVFSQMIQDEISKPIPVRTYTENDITVLKATDKKTALAYATAIDSANKKTIGALATPFVAAVQQYVSDNNPQELSRQSSAIAAYITALLATPVPQTWKTFHLGLINLLSKRFAYANAILDNNDSQLKIAAALSNIISLVDEEVELYKTMPTQ